MVCSLLFLNYKPPKMKRYDKYKESGISWIGEIPDHWEDSSFGRYFTFGKGLSITKRDLQEEGIAVISYGQIHSRQNTGTSIKEELVRKVATDYLRTSSQSLLNLHDIVFADTSEDLEGAGNNAYNDYIEPLFAGYHTLIARPKGLPFPKYFAYLFQSRDWRKSVQSLVNGIKVYSITKTILKKSFLLLPPLSEQEAIVAYLEEKVAQMDNLVAKQEAQIAYLRELKQAIIAKAVTQGLNPQAPLRPSGVPWIDDIPEHWELKIGKRIYLANDGGVWGNDPDGENDTIVLRSTEQAEDGTLKIINPARRKLSAEEQANNKLVTGDLIITKSSGSSSHIGKTSLIDKETEKLGCCYSNFIQRIRIKGSSKYYWYVFNSPFVRGQFQNLATTTTGLGNLSQSLINHLLLPLPPLEEQAAIVEYLDTKTEQINRLINKTEESIIRMKELKQRLIADAVTGRINFQPS